MLQFTLIFLMNVLRIY